MPASMTPLRDEHRGLLPEIAALRDTADRVGIAPPDQMKEMIDGRLAFLDHHLRPHAQTEDEVLYPVVAGLMGGPDSVATMRRDHVEVHRLTQELHLLRTRLTDGTIDDDIARGLRRVLYGLFAIVSLHFAKEEEVYLPLLEQGLTADQADALFEDMGDAHHRAG